MPIKESTANSLVAAQRFVAGNARFIPGRFSDHVFHTAFSQVHQVARSENTGVAHSGGYVNLPSRKTLRLPHIGSLCHSGCFADVGRVMVASSGIRQRSAWRPALALCRYACGGTLDAFVPRYYVTREANFVSARASRVQPFRKARAKSARENDLPYDR